MFGLTVKVISKDKRCLCAAAIKVLDEESTPTDEAVYFILGDEDDTVVDYFIQDVGNLTIYDEWGPVNWTEVLDDVIDRLDPDMSRSDIVQLREKLIGLRDGK